MARYIDADALIEAMRKTEEEYEKAMTCPSWWSAYRVIEEQPTAYDVEAVVAELKSKHTLSSGNDAYMWNKAIDTAISIVRNGGKE